MEDNVKSEVRQFILKKFPLAKKQNVSDDGALLESGMLDSQGVLEVVNFIEQQYSMVVSDEDLVPENFQSIDRIAGFVRGRMNGAPLVQH
jgi:acyl carrier protein